MEIATCAAADRCNKLQVIAVLLGHQRGYQWVGSVDVMVGRLTAGKNPRLQGQRKPFRGVDGQPAEGGQDVTGGDGH